MATTLLMPKATAVWLVDNTSLSFEQIAAFCGLHPLEVQGVADGDVAGGIMGVNPIQNGQLTREEIEKAEADPEYRMKVSDPKVRVAAAKRKGPRYTPISRRNERPNAIRWLLRNHPELKDAQIMRLVGTTKSTIELGAREYPLELGQHSADGSGDAGPLQPDRSRSRSEARRQGHRFARRGRSGHDAAHRRGSAGDRRRPHRSHRPAGLERAARSTRKTSTRTRCSPSSRRSRTTTLSATKL